MLRVNSLSPQACLDYISPELHPKDTNYDLQGRQASLGPPCCSDAAPNSPSSGKPSLTATACPQATPPTGFLPRLHPHLASFPGYHRQGQQRGQSPSAPRCSSGLGHTSARLTQLPACLLPPKLLSPVEWLDLGVDCCSEGPLATA